MSGEQEQQPTTDKMTTEQMRRRIAQLEAADRDHRENSEKMALKLENAELKLSVAKSEKQIAGLQAENVALKKWKENMLKLKAEKEQQQQQKKKQGQAGSSSNNSTAPPPDPLNVPPPAKRARAEEHGKVGVARGLGIIEPPKNNRAIKSNCWNTELAKLHGWKVADPLTVNVSREYSQMCTSVRAVTPFPAKSVAGANDHQYFYFEVLVKKKSPISLMNIGLASEEYPMAGTFVGQKLRSFAVSNWGYLLVEGDKHWNNQDDWTHQGGGTVVGCGLLDLPGDGRKLFFTRDGELYHKPIPLTTSQAIRDLYPMVSTWNVASIEANFGGGEKPFQFDCDKLADELLLVGKENGN